MSQIIKATNSLLVSSTALLSHLLNNAEGFFINKRFVRIGDNDPLGLWTLTQLFPFGKAVVGTPLHHMSKIGLTLKDYLNDRNVPN